MPAHLKPMIACLLMLLLAAGVVSGQEPVETPSAADALFESAKASLAEGKYQEAEASFRKVAEMEPTLGRGMRGVAGVYLAQKRNDEAITLLQEEAKKYPKSLDYRLNIGDIALVTGKFDLAVAELLFVLNRTAKNSKDAGELYHRLGQAYLGQGKRDFAIIFFRQAADLLPGNAEVRTRLGITLDVSGQKEAAARAYRDALEIDPNNRVLLNNMAFLLSEQGGNLDKALAYAKHARELAPNSDAVADTLGWVSLKKNLTDEAISLFREAVQKDPARSTFRYHLAVGLEQKGDHAGALEELQAALKNNPPSGEEQMIKDLIQKIGK